MPHEGIRTDLITAEEETKPSSGFARVFSRPTATTGVIGWLTTVDHKKIGIMYGLAALFFLIVGGVEALLIRLQLAVPNSDFISAQLYNELFTMHGTTMIFLAVMPLGAAFFNYIIPLQIGARDVAFPRLNAFSLWTFIAGGIFINTGWFLNLLPAIDQAVPKIGWFGYANLTSAEFSGVGTDFWVFGLQILGIASIVAALNFIVTIINMRAPGMTMMRLPVFTWMVLVTSFLIILAFPAITIALACLMMDRMFGTGFFEPVFGGQPILWQHLFWIFGHPEVYILILPAMGIISEVLPTFSRKPLFGYAIIVFSGALIGVLGFAVWAHHMFTTGLSTIAKTAFALATMAIAVPTGVKIFNWIGTMWGGQIRFTTPMLFALGFIWMFMIGGFSGIMHAAAPADSQQHDTYFVVAHFHYVLIGGSLFALFTGLYYWIPKISGKMFTDNLGKWVFWFMFVGFNVTFFPHHFLGLGGMPRRTYQYDADMGLNTWNMVSTIGSFILGIGILLFLYHLVVLIKKGAKAGNDPWDGRTLEWTLSSPPPDYNFAAVPKVTSRDEFWARKMIPEKKELTARETPDKDIHMPSPSWFPLIVSIGILLGAYGMALLKSGYSFIGFGTLFWPITGLIIIIAGIYGWAFEGPGGYHLHPEDEKTDKDLSGKTQ